MRSTPDTLLLYSKACITSAKIHFHIVNQANMAYNNLCVSQNISALCGSRITSHCPALLPIVQGGTPFIVPDILNHILPQSHTDNKYKNHCFLHGKIKNLKKKRNLIALFYCSVLGCSKRYTGCFSQIFCSCGVLRSISFLLLGS